MTTRQTDIYRLDIDHGTSDTPPPRQTNAQQNGTAYIWHSTTQELLPILPPDHPDYEANANMVMAPIPRWNGETKWVTNRKSGMLKLLRQFLQTIEEQ